MYIMMCNIVKTGNRYPSCDHRFGLGPRFSPPPTKLMPLNGISEQTSDYLPLKALGGDGRSERPVCQGPLESLRLPRHWRADRRLLLPPPHCGEKAPSWGQVLVLEAENRRWRWWSLEPWRREARGKETEMEGEMVGNRNEEKGENIQWDGEAKGQCGREKGRNGKRERSGGGKKKSDVEEKWDG